MARLSGTFECRAEQQNNLRIDGGQATNAGHNVTLSEPQAQSQASGKAAFLFSKPKQYVTPFGEAARPSVT
jgi:hypothetical protein